MQNVITKQADSIQVKIGETVVTINVKVDSQNEAKNETTEPAAISIEPKEESIQEPNRKDDKVETDVVVKRTLIEYIMGDLNMFKNIQRYLVFTISLFSKSIKLIGY